MNTLEQTLRDTQARVSWLEAQGDVRRALQAQAQQLRSRLSKRRQLAQHRGVPMWDGAQRAALRMGVLALGCVAFSTGAMALDATLGGVSIVVSLGVLSYEGLR